MKTARTMSMSYKMSPTLLSNCVPSYLVSVIDFDFKFYGVSYL